MSGTGLAVSLGIGLWNIYLTVSGRRETLLIAHRDRSAVANSVEQVHQYCTIYCIDLLIVNTSLTRTITVADYRLEVEWKDESLRLMADPSELGPKDAVYRVPFSQLELPRDEVLNHRRLTEGIIAPGQLLAGTLIFQGTAEVPSHLYCPVRIGVTVVVVDAKGKEHRSKNTFVMPTKSFPGVVEPLPPGIRVD